MSVQLKPMTNGELFKRIDKILEEKNLKPEHLDYTAPERYNCIEILDDEFLIKNNLSRGTNEGIYLDLAVDYYEENSFKTFSLGTYKTLRRDSEAMMDMAKLLGNFLNEFYSYVQENTDLFRWTGYNVRPIKDGKISNYGLICYSKENALKEAKKLLEKHDQVWVRDNSTREEKTYSMEDLI